MTTNYKDICEMFNDSKAYAMEKNINKIILFAKGIENVLKFKNILDETDIELIITTFPSNQVLYIEDEEEGIIETHPEILSFENRTKLKSLNIPLITSTFHSSQLSYLEITTIPIQPYLKPLIFLDPALTSLYNLL